MELVGFIIGFYPEKQGKRGGRTHRQRTQIRKNTPDASGNVLHLLEQMIRENLPRSNT